MLETATNLDLCRFLISLTFRIDTKITLNVIDIRNMLNKGVDETKGIRMINDACVKWLSSYALHEINGI